MAQAHTSSGQTGVFKWMILGIVGVALYVARDICIPFALATLLSFLLVPVVSRLQKWRISRIPAVLIVVVMLLLFLSSMGWLVLGQLIQLADKLPQYQATVHEKLDKLHTRPGSTLDRLNRTFESYASEVESIASQPANSQPATAGSPAVETRETPKAIEVRLAKPRTSGLDILRNLAMRALQPLATLGLMLVLTLFMLIQREDIRDRVLRLLGRGQLQLSTTAINDAAGRVSRYLLMQLVVNTIFGLCTFIGLYFIGVPNSPLWGLVAACLRFMPYFGVPAAALPPTLLAFVATPGFMGILLTVFLFTALEILICYFVEPWLYGSRTGISPLAILGSAIFWGWIWGPVGLLLSTPLTVCLAVLGRHVPNLRYLDIIFGDQPALTPDLRFYQRLLAGDQDEATEIAEQFLQQSSSLELYDSLLLPALAMAEQERHRGELDDDRLHSVYDFLRELIDDVEDRTPAQSIAVETSILCVPANDEADELAARMLAGQLRHLGAIATVLSVESLAGECVKSVDVLKPDVVCISAVPPHAIMHARYLSKRLRAAQPQLRIIVCLWHASEEKTKIDGRLPPLVNDVVTTIRGAMSHFTTLRQTWAEPDANAVAPRAEVGIDISH